MPRTYSSADLAGILGTLSEAGGARLQVIPADRIDQSMAQARQFLENVTITPEECAIFVSNSLEAPEGAAYSTAVSTVNGDAVQTIVTASSSADAARQQTMSLVGTSAGLAVTAVRTAQDVLPEDTQDELQALVDQTLAAAKG